MDKDNSQKINNDEQDTSKPIGTLKIPGDLLNYIPKESALHYKVIPLSFKDDNLVIGSVNPDDLDVLDALNFIASKEGVTYKIRKITDKEFERLSKQYSEASIEIGKAISEIKGDSEKKIPGEEDISHLIKSDAPVVKLVDNIFIQAVRQKASDIHIEPTDKDLIVRYRVDGVLDVAHRLNKKLHSSMVARVKISASLRLDEKRRPQDGRFSKKIGDSRVDFRVAVFPTSEGEKVILRVLDRNSSTLSLDQLGLPEEHKKVLLNIIKEPYGLILSTGPTGSGKTTTLYSLMELLDRKSKNVVSLEDPVEYSVDGINQSEIRPEIGYTFANGLRSILRGDPDVILVGEIRDSETAQLAVQAALTGHLVFSTVHTNNAVSAVTRLIDLGIEPFLLAPTLKLIIGQRLTRKLCEGAGKKVPASSIMKEKINENISDLPEKYRKKFPAIDNFYEITPTEECPQGTRGRIGVFEVLPITETLATIILETPSDIKVYEQARKEGMTTMYEDAIKKGIAGIIPITEVNKIGNEDLVDVEDIQYKKEPEIENSEVSDAPAQSVEDEIPLDQGDKI